MLLLWMFCFNSHREVLAPAMPDIFLSALASCFYFQGFALILLEKIGLQLGFVKWMFSTPAVMTFFVCNILYLQKISYLQQVITVGRVSNLVQLCSNSCGSHFSFVAAEAVVAKFWSVHRPDVWNVHSDLPHIVHSLTTQCCALMLKSAISALGVTDVAQWLFHLLFSLVPPLGSRLI